MIYDSVLSKYFMLGHYRDILRSNIIEIFCEWALLGEFMIGYYWDRINIGIGYCRDILRSGIVGILCRWALQRYSAERCSDIRRWTAGIFWNWSLQGYLKVGHCWDILRMGILSNSGRRARIIYILKSDNPITREKNTNSSSNLKSLAQNFWFIYLSWVIYGAADRENIW